MESDAAGHKGSVFNLSGRLDSGGNVCNRPAYDPSGSHGVQPHALAPKGTRKGLHLKDKLYLWDPGMRGHSKQSPSLNVMDPQGPSTNEDAASGPVRVSTFKISCTFGTPA